MRNSSGKDDGVPPCSDPARSPQGPVRNPAVEALNGAKQKCCSTQEGGLSQKDAVGSEPVIILEGVPTALARARYSAELYWSNDRVRIWLIPGTGKWETNGVQFCNLVHETEVGIKSSLAFIESVSESDYLPVKDSGLKGGERILVDAEPGAPLRASVVVVPPSGGAVVLLDDHGVALRLSPDAKVAILGKDRVLPPMSFCIMNVSPEDNNKVATVQEKLPSDRHLRLVTDDGKVLYAFNWRTDLAVPLSEDCIEVPAVQYKTGSKFLGRLMWVCDHQKAVYVMEEEEAVEVSRLEKHLRVYYERACRRIQPGEENPEEGEMGISEDPRGSVSRCIVKKFVEKEGSRYLKVEFLDLGIDDEVPVSKFLRLPIHLAKLTKFGVRMELDIPDGRRLSADAFGCLEKLSLSEEAVMIDVKTSSGGMFIVDVQDAQTGKSILDLEPLPTGYGEPDAAHGPMWPIDVTMHVLPRCEQVVEVLSIPEDEELPYDFCAVPVSRTTHEVDKKADEAGRNATEPYQPGLNEVVLALDEDGRWYRAVAFPGNRVWFLDYGTMRSVTPAEVRPIPMELAKEPVFGNFFVITGRFKDLVKAKEKVMIACEKSEPLNIRIKGVVGLEDFVAWEIDVFQ